MPKITIGNYLLKRIHEIGVRHLIGVPGDFNLAFLEQLLQFDGIEWIGTCNELNAAYAADGYARMNGIGAMLVTYGVGDLSALNGIAGAYAEHVPVVCISGVPPLHAIRRRAILHHTSGTGEFDDVMTCLGQFTSAQARITPANAAIEIDRLLATCLREKCPVYLQLPSDISYLEIEAPESLLDLRTGISDALQLQKAVDLIAHRIEQARRPTLLVDADAHRFGLRPLLCGLGERCGIPFASILSGRSTFNEQHPLYRGIYAGASSAPEAIAAVEESDCLLMVGVRFFDATSGYFSHRIPTEETIVLDPFSVKVGSRIFEGVTARDVLAALLEKLPHTGSTAPSAIAAPPDTFSFGGNDKLTHLRLWPRIARFFREHDVILAESGTSQAGLAEVRIPANSTFISQATWGSIGYTLPALLGSLLAAPGRRHLLFIGDGSFQLTAQEISTILRHDMKPVIFVVNNGGYTIEREILGPDSAYNDVQNWRYAELPAVLGPQRAVRSFTVSTEAELNRALDETESATQFTLIELLMDRRDAPAGLKRMAAQAAQFDFGEP
jgi:indolepyruvate decarboxylase